MQLKMMIHSVVWRGAHYMCIDIKDYYLHTRSNAQST
jgi:hypothetical protein